MLLDKYRRYCCMKHVGGRCSLTFVRCINSAFEYHVVTFGFFFKGSLVNFLEHISHFGNIVYKFNKFVDSVANDNSCHGFMPPSSPPVPTSRTYQAFGSALFEFLQQLRRCLVKIEKKVREQGC